jgi:hypothetical protein
MNVIIESLHTLQVVESLSPFTDHQLHDLMAAETNGYLICCTLCLLSPWT